MLVHTLTHTLSTSLVFLLHVNEMFIFVFNLTGTLDSHPFPHLLMHTPRGHILVATASVFTRSKQWRKPRWLVLYKLEIGKVSSAHASKPEKWIQRRCRAAVHLAFLSHIKTPRQPEEVARPHSLPWEFVGWCLLAIRPLNAQHTSLYRRYKHYKSSHTKLPFL